MKIIEDKSNCELYFLNYSHLEEAAILLECSFINYPLHQYIFQKDWRKINNFFRWYFRCLLKSYFKTAKIIGIGKPLKGICVYSIPTSPSTSILDFILAGLYQLPFKVSVTSIARLMRINRYLTKFKKQNREKNRTHIDILAIDPKYQGEGFGRQLFRCIANQFDNVYLETHKLENIKFYERLGCKLVQTKSLPKSSLTTFLMTYKRSSST